MAKQALKKEEKKNHKVDFSFQNHEAQKVILAGDFNNWNVNKHSMKANGEGIWEKSMYLSPGEYEYKFLVDGSWVEDPRNDKQSLNCFGTLNSVIQIPG